MPIRVRLALAFTAVTLVLVVVGGWLFLSSFEMGLERSLVPGLRAQLDAIAGTKPRAGGESTETVLTSRDRVEQILDRSGRIVESSPEAGRRAVVSSAVIRRAFSTPTFMSINVGREQEPFRAFARRVSIGGHSRVVVVATSLEPTREAVRRARQGLLVGGVIAVIVAGVGGYLLAAAALRPVERMRSEAALISTNDLTGRLPVPATKDEIATLAVTMNELLAELQGALARERTFVADAGHELRTPLAVLRTELELADRPHRSPEELRDAISHAVQETDRLAQLADQLLLLARWESDRGAARSMQSVGAVIQRCVDGAPARMGRTDVTVESDDAVVAAAIDADLVGRAVDNLLDNALRVSPEGGTVRVSASSDQGWVTINVCDEGPGFPSEFLPHAFERFRRADESRARSDGGTGLGLAIVLAVAQSHGGTAEVDNQRDGGAIATMRLPENM